MVGGGIIGMAFQGASNNRTCQICEESEATHFCKCTGSSTVWTAVASTTKTPTHPQVTPTAALSQHPEDYQRKYEALTQGTAELRRNVGRMEQCYVVFGPRTTSTT